MSFSPIHIWASMGLMSKIIASLLLVMATMSLAVVVERWVALIRAKGETRKFLGSVVPLLGEQHYPEAAKLADEHKASPFARLIAPILRKLTSTEEKNLTRVELARREAERQKEAVGEELRRGMGVLASVGSVAPFVGLLGTVVGIISAFQGIASSGSGGLSSVAAGISEALVETALGLAVAIPAVLGFNYLSNSIAMDERALATAAGELADTIEGWAEADGPEVRRERVA
jgi:biopolymer transport protein ExbB/TolQ